MRFTLTAVVLVATITVLQADMWTGDKGISEVMSLQTKIKKQQDENQAMRDKNQAIYREVDSLKTSDVLVEEKARLDLGLIKKGEHFYQIGRSDGKNAL